MSSAILNLDVEKSAVTLFNSATTSCIAPRIVPLNVDKNGGMICGGFCEKSVSYNTFNSDSSSWILNGLVSSCSTNVDISDDESGMAKGILFKPRVETTKQLTQNWTFRGRAFLRRPENFSGPKTFRGSFRVNYSGPGKRFSTRPKTPRILTRLFRVVFSGLQRELDTQWFV